MEIVMKNITEESKTEIFNGFNSIFYNRISYEEVTVMEQQIQGIFSFFDRNPFFPCGIGDDANCTMYFDIKFFSGMSRVQIVRNEYTMANFDGTLNEIG